MANLVLDLSLPGQIARTLHNFGINLVVPPQVKSLERLSINVILELFGS